MAKKSIDLRTHNDITKPKKKSKRTIHQLFASIALFRGTETTSEQDPVIVPLTRPLTMPEVKLLWEAERALNSLPTPIGYKVVIDIAIERIK